MTLHIEGFDGFIGSSALRGSTLDAGALRHGQQIARIGPLAVMNLRTDCVIMVCDGQAAANGLIE